MSVDAAAWEALRLSLWVACWATLLAVPLALWVAWLLARRRFWGKSLLNALVHLPLVLPPVVTGYLLLIVFGKSGPIGQSLASVGLTLAFHWTGAVLAAIVMGFPLMVRAMRLAIEAVDPRLEQAAATLGATPMATFTRVILAQLMPALLTGTALAFTRSLGEYGAVIFIAGNMPFETEILSLLVNIRLDEFDYAAASALASVILIASLVLLFGIQLVQSRLTRRWKGH